MPVSTWLQPPPTPVAEHWEEGNTMVINLHHAPESYYKTLTVTDGDSQASVTLRRHTGDHQTQLNLILDKPNVACILSQFTGLPFA